MIQLITQIVAAIMVFIFMPVLTFVAIGLWKEMHGDNNWMLRMWARYVMKEVPLSSEEDFINLLQRNTLDDNSTSNR
jgi:hypothetical protein